MARAFLFQAHLPQTFWGPAILMATHVINKLPSQILHWKSPYEVLHGHPPDYTFLKTFGCLCFAANTSPHKSKLDTRTFTCCFIGYSSSQKAYRVYDLNTHKLFVTRDVKFYENIFPFSKTDSSLTHTST